MSILIPRGATNSLNQSQLVIDMQNLYRQKHLEQLIPSRSKLFYLPPIGIASPHVESLTSYISRLAQAHSVTVRTLLVEMIFPLYGRNHLRQHSLRVFWDELARALNGPNVSSRDMVCVLAQLTHISDLHALTLLRWEHVIPSRGLLRPFRAWCPACYAEWKCKGTPLYNPLNWALEDVTVCTLHQQKLHQTCPACQLQQQPLSAQTHISYCDHCGYWLGATGTESQTERYETLVQEVWQASMLGELLANTVSAQSVPTRAHIAAIVSTYVTHAGQGSNGALARLLGCTKYTIRDCRNGQYLLQLRTLLRLAEVANVSLERLLCDTALVENPPPMRTAIAAFPQAYRDAPRRVDKQMLQRQLQEELTQVDAIPRSLRTVAQSLGYDMSYLVKIFPEETWHIKERYATFVEQRKQQTYAQARAELPVIMEKMVAAGIYPSQKRVAAELTHGWFLRLPEGRELWRQLIASVRSYRHQE